MKLYLKVIFSLIFTLVLVVGLTFFIDKSLLQVQEIELVLDNSSQENFLFSKIKKQLDPKLKTFIGSYVWDVNLEKLLNLISEDKRVLSATVRRKIPNKVILKLKPHHPLAILMGNKGELHPVAIDGSLLNSRKSNSVPDVPILRGMNFHSKVKLRMKAVGLLAKLPELGLLSRASVSEVRFSKKYGFVFYLLENGEQVRLGSSNVEIKFKQIEKVLSYLESESLGARVIDARFPKKVVVKPRNAP